jgi:hypothetical protein
MSDSSSSQSLIGRLKAFRHLLERLVESGHSAEALFMAQTILDRSERPFVAEPSVYKNGGTLCDPSEFVAVQKILKAIEGPEGAALDGLGFEPDLARGSRRFGSVGLRHRREALHRAVTTLQQTKAWRPRIRKFFATPESGWRWRESGWLPKQPLMDAAFLLFQPLVVIVGPSRFALEQAAIVLEQLCSPPPLLPSNLNKPECSIRRSPYAAAILLDAADSNPAEILQLLRTVAGLRTDLSDRGWPLPAMTVLSLTADDAAERLANGLLGQDVGLREMAAGFAPEKGLVEKAVSTGARVVLSRMESLHHFAALLWDEYGAEEPVIETMNRARKIPPGLIPEETVGGADREEILYVFPHIPKTAGTSVYAHLRNHLELDREFISFPSDGGPYQLSESIPFAMRDIGQRRQARILFGHGVLERHADFVPGRTVRQVTTLRDPADQILSNYNFTMGLNERNGIPLSTFEEWYREQPRNFQAVWLLRNYAQAEMESLSDAELLAKASALLDSFWLVCTIETLAADANRLFSAMGLPPFDVHVNAAGVSYPRRHEMDEALRQRLRSENGVDFELHQRWLRRRGAETDNCPA